MAFVVEVVLRSVEQCRRGLHCRIPYHIKCFLCGYSGLCCSQKLLYILFVKHQPATCSLVSRISQRQLMQLVYKMQFLQICKLPMRYAVVIGIDNSRNCLQKITYNHGSPENDFHSKTKLHFLQKHSCVKTFNWNGGLALTFSWLLIFSWCFSTTIEGVNFPVEQDAHK